MNQQNFWILAASLIIITIICHANYSRPIQDDEIWNVASGNIVIANGIFLQSSRFNFEQPPLGKFILAFFTFPSKEELENSKTLIVNGSIHGKESLFENQVKRGRIENYLITIFGIIVFFILFSELFYLIWLILLYYLFVPQLSLVYLEPILFLFSLFFIYLIPKSRNFSAILLFFIGLIKNWYYLLFAILFYYKYHNLKGKIILILTVFAVLFVYQEQWLAYLIYKGSIELTSANTIFTIATAFRYQYNFIPLLIYFLHSKEGHLLI